MSPKLRADLVRQESLERQLEALKVDLAVDRKQSQARHAYLAGAAKHLGKAIAALAKPGTGTKT
jgi:hypothetical protein